MNKPDSCYTPGVIGTIEQFTIAEEELRQFVLYTYYDKAGNPLYLGCSKAFYDAHYFNSERLPFFSEIEYVGFIFLRDERDMKDAKKHYMKARNPRYNRMTRVSVELSPEIDWFCDDLVVKEKEMRQRWREFLDGSY